MTGKIYLENPYLKDLRGKIIKKEKKDDRYHIVLNRTIFYPRHSEITNIDKGTINGIKVMDVFESENDIVHVTDKNIGSKDIIMQIDWNMRFDYMQQHTGQHILAAAINKLCGLDSFDFNYDSDYSYMKMNFKAMTLIDNKRIERFANHIVFSNFKIKASALEKRQSHKKDRTVSIENVSSTPCEGLHCSSTGEVGMIKIIEFNADEKNHIDIKFVCGNRALRDYTTKGEELDKIAKILAVKNKDISDELEIILDTNRKLKEEIECLKTPKTIDDNNE